MGTTIVEGNNSAAAINVQLCTVPIQEVKQSCKKLVA
jgi:hypothetical protein